jgi:hypothetical protein
MRETRNPVLVVPYEAREAALKFCAKHRIGQESMMALTDTGKAYRIVDLLGDLLSFRVRFLKKGDGDKKLPPWISLRKLRELGYTGVRVKCCLSRTRQTNR